MGLAAEQKQLDTLMTEKLQLTAQRKKAEANLRLANISLERTTVRAPFDGYVADMSELTTIARPYAKAAFELAVEKGAIDSWNDMLS